MSKPFVIPFKATHLLSFVNRDTDMLVYMRDATRKELAGPAYTGVYNDKVIGCAGVMLLWPGVGEAWVALDKDIEKHGLWMTRVIKHIFRDIIVGCRLHRVEAVVLADNDRNLKWIRTLGFGRENGTARQYTSDKKDVVRFEFLC